MCFTIGMESQPEGNPPSQCPVCKSKLLVTRLECSSCGTEVTGAFGLGRLATTPEPHASLLEMFLRVRGNVKEMERELGLSYPTVRARLDEAFEAAGYGRPTERSTTPGEPGWPGPDLEERIRAQVDRGLAQVERQLAEMDLGGWTRRRPRNTDSAQQRSDILGRLERGEITAEEATDLLRKLKERG
jgi:hypothetical protein